MISIEENIVGTWRSYKLFCFTGTIEHHNPSFFIQFSIDQNRDLTMFHARVKRQVLTLKSGEWKIVEIRKRRYLYFGKRQAYELITVEPEDLVLADLVKGDKIFLAKMPRWHQRIEPVVTSVRHIRPEKKRKTADA